MNSTESYPPITEFEAQELSDFIYQKKKETLIMNPVAAPEPTTLIPQSKFEDIQKLDLIVDQSREMIRTARPMTRAFLAASAMKAIEDSITKEMFADIKNLMDSPLGFKTDRAPGTRAYKEKGAYSDSTIKRCVIVALLHGSELAGNQFNIIAGQCYLTKEHMTKIVHTWPGLREFQMEIGPPMKHGDKTAAMEGKAEWVLNGEVFSVECYNQDGRDMRIVVNSYSVSGPDQLRGLAESKLLRRVVDRLTGLGALDEDDSMTVDGAIVEPEKLESSKQETAETNNADPKPTNTELDSLKFENADAAHALVMAAREEVAQQKSIVKTTQVAQGRLEELKATVWSADAKCWALEEIEKAKKDRIAELRSSR